MAYLSRAYLSGANLDKKHFFLSIYPIGSENGCLWVMLDNTGIIKYNKGYFSGTKDEFLSAITKKHGENNFAVGYKAAVDFIEIKFANWKNDKT